MQYFAKCIVTNEHWNVYCICKTFKGQKFHKSVKKGVNHDYFDFSCKCANSTCAVPKIVSVPPWSILLCLSTLGRYHAIYTRCIIKIHSLATTSGPTHKVGVV